MPPLSNTEAVFPLLDVTLIWATQHRLPPAPPTKTPSTNALALWYVQSGYVDVRFHSAEKETVRLIPGDAVLMTTDRPRSIHAVGANEAQWLSCGFAIRLFAQDHSLRLFPPLVVWRPPAESADRLRSLMETAFAYCAPSSVPSRLSNPFPLRSPRSAAAKWAANGVARSLLYEMWQQIIPQERGNTPPLPDTPHRLLLALLHAERAVATASVSTMAEAANISESQLTRLFHRLGTTPQKQLGRIRLEKAALALRDTDDTTNVIAASVGFASVSHFTRCFAAQYGLPPAKYRHQQRALQP